MTWFMLAMIAYPDVQKKCQEELDRVVGRSRMPTFKDRESLPYIIATVRELFRWRTTVPIGELLSNMSHPIHFVHQEVGESGLQHYSMEVTFLLSLRNCQMPT